MIMDGMFVSLDGFSGRRSETDKNGSKFGAVDLFLRRTGIRTGIRPEAT